jgi:hypothetical protein
MLFISYPSLSLILQIGANFIVKQNNNIRFNWWWDNLKTDRFSLEFTNDDAWKYLHLLINKNEKAWLIACDSNRYPGKYWLF